MAAGRSHHGSFACSFCCGKMGNFHLDPSPRGIYIYICQRYICAVLCRANYGLHKGTDGANPVRASRHDAPSAPRAKDLSKVNPRWARRHYRRVDTIDTSRDFSSCTAKSPLVIPTHGDYYRYELYHKNLHPWCRHGRDICGNTGGGSGRARELSMPSRMYYITCTYGCACGTILQKPTVLNGLCGVMEAGRYKVQGTSFTARHRHPFLSQWMHTWLTGVPSLPCVYVSTSHTCMYEGLHTRNAPSSFSIRVPSTALRRRHQAN